MFTFESLKSLAHSSSTAECIFLALSQRERPRTVLNLTLLKKTIGHKNIKTEAFMEVFKKLESMGIGELTYGRGGNPVWFTWTYDLRDIANIGIGSENLELRKMPTVAMKKKGSYPRQHLSDFVRPRAVQEPQQPAIAKTVSIDTLIQVLEGLKRQ